MTNEWSNSDDLVPELEAEIERLKFDVSKWVGEAEDADDRAEKAERALKTHRSMVAGLQSEYRRVKRERNEAREAIGYISEATVCTETGGEVQLSVWEDESDEPVTMTAQMILDAAREGKKITYVNCALCGSKFESAPNITVCDKCRS